MPIKKRPRRDTLKITNLPQSVLRQLLNQALARPGTLTTSETDFAQRIRQCAACCHLWVQRLRHKPRRCPNCFSTQWDLPTVRNLVTGEATTKHPRKEGAAE